MENQETVEFWKSLISETTSVNDPVFLEYLQSIDANRLWNTATDENLKSFLGLINRLSNESKSRSLGLTLLSQFIGQVNSSRFLVIQENLSSSLHIAVKYIDQELVQKLFADVLPRCQEALELNQTVSSSIIPKILSHLSSLRPNETNRSLSIEEVKLLRICLEHFHGPCGNHRNNFEKMLLPFIDSDNEVARASIFKIIPLLSASGSGGSKRSKHGQDWYAMNVKILHAMHDAILQLYSDASPALEEYNPYETEFGTLELPAIKEKNVFIRYSLLKQRVVNLATLLGHYLSELYPIPKPVPVKSILNIICKMVLLNPVDLLKKKRSKEHIYLSGILPAIHEAALCLVHKLISCVGSNLLPESERIEQLSLQEIKWLSRTPQAFQKLKIRLYNMLLKWVAISKGFVASSKTLSTWITQIQVDMRIEKSSTTLSVKSSKSKTGSKKKVNSAQTQSLSKMLASSEQATVEKDPKLCAASLELLQELIPVLDAALHKTVYELIAKTVLEILQDPLPPSPYNDDNCRVKMLKCVQALVVNPHPKSPVSLGILLTLAHQTSVDLNPIFAECRSLLSSFEKIIHPAVPTFEFPSVFSPESNVPEPESESARASDGFQAHQHVDTRDNFCQTTDAELPNPPVSFQEADVRKSGSEIPEALTLSIQSTIRKGIRELFAELPHHFQNFAEVNAQNNQNQDQSFGFGERNFNSSPKLVNGLGKRASNIADDATVDHEKTDGPEYTKRARTETEKEEADNADCNEWLNDFVDLSPTRE